MKMSICLAQVRAIFWLTSFVMVDGFKLIGRFAFGVSRPAKFNASGSLTITVIVNGQVGSKK
jgi:hypothetical protein